MQKFPLVVLKYIKTTCKKFILTKFMKRSNFFKTIFIGVAEIYFRTLQEQYIFL